MQCDYSSSVVSLTYLLCPNFEPSIISPKVHSDPNSNLNPNAWKNTRSFFQNVSLLLLSVYFACSLFLFLFLFLRSRIWLPTLSLQHFLQYHRSSLFCLVPQSVFSQPLFVCLFVCFCVCLLWWWWCRCCLLVFCNIAVSCTLHSTELHWCVVVAKPICVSFRFIATNKNTGPESHPRGLAAAQNCRQWRGWGSVEETSWVVPSTRRNRRRRQRQWWQRQV